MLSSCRMPAKAFISRVSRSALLPRHSNIQKTCIYSPLSTKTPENLFEPDKLRKTFGDGETAFRGKTYTDLLRSYLVLRLCCFETFANNAHQIFLRLQRFIGPRLFSLAFKPTVYKNFIAGSSKDEILSTASSLSQSGLMPLISPMLEDSPDAGDFNEAMYARNKDVIRESIEICSQVENLGGQPKCLAVKLTALIPAQILADLTEALGPEESISSENIQQMSQAMVAGDTNMLPSLQLSSEAKARLQAALPILMWLGEECLDKKVSVYIDAEFTQFQPGVRLLSLSLAHLFNKSTQTVWNTYQCYLKLTEKHVRDDTVLLNSLNTKWAGKIVRGAYMQYERKRAKEMGKIDPVQETYSLTSDAYNRTVEYLLEGVSKGHDWRFIIASHNQESVLRACSKYKQLKIEDNVFFGQIAGMGEGISCGLAQTGFSVYKLVPTGTVDEVLPWLARRMEENKGMMEGAVRDRIMIRNELKRRTFKLS